jgi:hypothetical protein
MNACSSRIRVCLMATLVAGLLAVSETETRGAHGGQRGGASHPPHVAAPRQTFRAPRMPQSSASARVNSGQGQMRMPQARANSNNSRSRASKGQAHSNNSQTRASNSQTRANNSQARLNNSQARLNNSSTNAGNTTPSASGGGVSPSTTASINARHSLSSSVSPNTYTYGYGPAASSYRAYGYGRGYRNRYYGGGYGYGRSQGNNRAIVARLQSVHSSLARLNQDYQGHRSRALHSISMAIRQLSHRSMGYNGTGFGAGMNNGMGGGMGRGMGVRRSALGGAGGGGMRMNQAQSDARMSQALRNLQGIGMQLANQGSNTMGQGRALGHVQMAAHELNVALSIR